jgi:hypothetical protein
MTCAPARVTDALGRFGSVFFGWHTPCFKVFMLNKQHLIQTIFDRTHILLGAATVILSPAKLAAGLKNSLNIAIPEGYQDETGFHFGAKPTVEHNH